MVKYDITSVEDDELELHIDTLLGTTKRQQNMPRIKWCTNREACLKLLDMVKTHGVEKEFISFFKKVTRLPIEYDVLVGDDHVKMSDGLFVDLISVSARKQVEAFILTFQEMRNFQTHIQQ